MRDLMYFCHRRQWRVQNDLNIHGIPTTVARLSARIPISPCTHIKQDSQRPAAFARHIAMSLFWFFLAYYQQKASAGSEHRTHTVFLPTDFESAMSAIPSYPLNKRQFLESSKNRTALQLAIRSTVKNPSVIPRTCIVVYQSYRESDFYLLCSSPCLYKYCITYYVICQ